MTRPSLVTEAVRNRKTNFTPADSSGFPVHTAVDNCKTSDSEIWGARSDSSSVFFEARGMMLVAAPCQQQ